MFESTKENNPFSGGPKLFIQRMMNTQRRKVVFSIIAAIFCLWLLSSFFGERGLERYEEDQDEDSTLNRYGNNNKNNNNQNNKQYNVGDGDGAEPEPVDGDSPAQPRLNDLQLLLQEKDEQLHQESLQVERLEREKQKLQQDKENLESRLQELEEQQSLSPKPNSNCANDNSNSNNSGGSIDHKKRNAVKEAMLFAWKGYEDHVWGKDELRPLDGSVQDWGGFGLTILDSLDTLWIMDLKDEFQKGRDWVAKNLSFNKQTSVSLFETTIRVMGGLLSAYELSDDKMFLDKAKDLGDRFLPAFNTPTGIPLCTVNLATSYAVNPGWTGGSSILSEVGTIQLEFATLSRHTKNPAYKEKAFKAFDALRKTNPRDGLYSVYVDPNSGKLTRDHITLGALGDSFYEYMLKLWVLTGESKFREMYDESAEGIIKELVKYSTPSNLLYIAEKIGGNINHKMDHLVCFAGAMFALGARGDTAEEHMKVGAGLTETCNQMYERTATGISAELVHFEAGNDFVVPGSARHYLLRPETVESFFVMWRKTHDPIWREHGWKAFQAINKYCKVKYGFSGIRDVTTINVSHDNLQQSFFMAETLKYLYLLFSEDDLIPLDEYVFNTEAHPVKIWK